VIWEEDDEGFREVWPFGSGMGDSPSSARKSAMGDSLPLRGTRGQEQPAVGWIAGSLISPVHTTVKQQNSDGRIMSDGCRRTLHCFRRVHAAVGDSLCPTGTRSRWTLHYFR
jgi:hypothetical protein